MKNIIKLNIIDGYLNKTTMYRLVLYALSALVIASLIASISKLIFFKPLELIVSWCVILGAAYGSNYLFSKFLKIETNYESGLITGFILYLLFYPSLKPLDIFYIALGTVVAIGSKYLITRHKKHIFNPAAFGAFVLNIISPGITGWWIGSASLFIPTLIAGLLVVRKIRRETLFLTTIGVSVVTIIIYSFYSNSDLVETLKTHFLSWPIIFFAAIMVTEPFTTPPTKKEQMIYGTVIGILSSWPFHIGPIYSSPELALLFANLYSYLFGFRHTLVLKLVEKKEIADHTYEFAFRDIFNRSLKKITANMNYHAGQYMEFTIPHSNPDTRGIRRYFTVASSPNDDRVKIGIKFAEKSSSFKTKLLSLNEGEVGVKASQLGGDFVLPADKNKKLVFVAGGIGVTPFASMIRFLVDQKDRRDIVLFYCCTISKEIAYKELLLEAVTVIGLKVIFVLSKQDKNEKPDAMLSKFGIIENGRITTDILKSHVNDCSDRIYYLSGPSAMVDSYKALIQENAPGCKIVTDYFPGFA